MTAAVRWCFGTVEVRRDERRLMRGTEPLKLGGRAFDLLIVLIEERHRVVSKAELLDRIWPRLVVEENNLQVQVMVLRRLLGPQAIATVPGRGYRFTALLHDEATTLGPTATVQATVPATEQAPLPTPGSAALIGRDDDLRELASMVGSHRLVTLLGAGGVGKSRLARQLMRQRRGVHAHGTVWLDLTTVAHAEALPGAVAAALELTPGRGDPVQALAAAVQTLQLLLVLDNGEHLVEAIAPLVQALHDRAPGLHLLLTSQLALRVSAERIYRLQPLALPDADATLAAAQESAAVQLFVDRVRASDRHFGLTAHNLAPAISLTRRLDGLPLAIEMAAARVPALSLAQLDDALRERFRVLTHGERGASPHQHTLQSALQWTHSLLSSSEQAVFRRLAVFSGSFSLPLAQQVCSDDAAVDEWQVLDALTVLVDRSLVTAPFGDPPRYRLLDTPHAFARQQLAASGESAVLHRRHAGAMRTLFDAACESHLQAAQQVGTWLAGIAPDNDNGLVALAWAQQHAENETALAIAPGLTQSLVRAHDLRFGVWQRTEPLLNDAIAAPVRARWLLGWAQFWWSNRPSRSRQRAAAAAELFRAEGHRVGEYRALAVLAQVVGDPPTEEHRAALVRMQALEDPAWPPGLRVFRRFAETTQLTTESRFEEALAAAEECLALDADAGREGRLARQIAVMYLEILAGRYDAAIHRGMAARARVLAQRKPAPTTGVDMFIVLSWVLKGEPEPARELAAEAWRIACQFVYQGPMAAILALLSALESRPRAAAQLLGFSAAAFERTQVQALPTARLPIERTEAIVARSLPAEEVAAHRQRGASLSDAAAGSLGLARADAQALSS